MLCVLDALPDGLLEATSESLLDRLGGPTLIHLPGEREPALFVSVLLHGNETVGWEAVRALLKSHLARWGSLRLPRAMSLFIGNVAAAAQGVRRLPEQPDYNRVWPGSETTGTPEHALMQQVIDEVLARGVFASVDLHNNTGLNPHYACVNQLDPRHLKLATLFSRTVVYFLRPRGVQSMALGPVCPAVTLECGKVGDVQGIHHAQSYLDACLRLAEISDHPVAAHDIDLFHTVAQVRIPDEVSFGFAPAEADLVLSPYLDHLNFRELRAGTALGRVLTPRGLQLEVRDEQGRDVRERFFHLEDGELRLRVQVMPSMLTCNETVIRQDCLCYLMERYNDHVPQRHGPGVLI